MNTLNLIHNDGSIPSIYFPAGKMINGGSCQFATKTCLHWCPSGCNPNTLEKAIYNYFKTQTAIEISTKLHMELLDRNRTFLQWFAWGDCPRKMTEKIAWIINKLHTEGITQIGFTRNHKLWLKVKDNVTFAFTVEDKTKIKKYCADGLVAYPDFKKNKTIMYKGLVEIKHGLKEKWLSSCTGTWCEESYDSIEIIPKELIHAASCDICMKHLRGCFKQ